LNAIDVGGAELWACARRYMSVESLGKAGLAVIPGGDPLAEQEYAN
jgi:hypothetical protein